MDDILRTTTMSSCRTCQKSNDGPMFGLFSASHHHNNTDDVIVLSTMLSACTQLFANPSDGMPNGICSACLAQLTSAYEFQQQCIRADQQIRVSLGIVGDPVTSNHHHTKKEKPHDIFETESAVFIKSETIEVQLNEPQPPPPIESDVDYCDGNNDDNDDYDDDDDKPIAKIQKPNKFACLQCDKLFANAYRLQRHSSTVHRIKEKPYECEICQSIFVLKSKLINHMATKHSAAATTETKAIKNEPKKPIVEYKCDYCTKTFFRRKTLVRHLKSHDQFRPSQCTLCDRTFSLGVQLAEHMAVKHTISKQHVCTVCQKGRIIFFFGILLNSNKKSLFSFPTIKYVERSHANAQRRSTVPVFGMWQIV